MIYENSTYELEEMKQQMALLKKKLEQQKIVNESVLRSAMKKKLSVLNKRGRMGFVAGIFVAIGAPVYFSTLGFSHLFCAATAVMLIFSAFKTFQYHRKLWGLNITESNLIELYEQTTLLRKRYKEWGKIAWCMIIPWVIWIIYEGYRMYGDETIYFMGGAAVGGIIGGIIGTRINNMIRRADELLEQINEYKKMQE